MKVRINQVLKVEHPKTRKMGNHFDYPSSYYELTCGTYSVGADIYKGIWAYREVNEPSVSFKRRPAVLLHSNPLKEDSLDVPWIDVIEPENGYAIYNGDNRTSSVSPLKSRGNSLLIQLASFYRSPQLRMYAPPILLFTQSMVANKRTGFRKFSGYGIPTRFTLQSQSSKKAAVPFMNLVIELALFSLDEENELFDWGWIDLRRDGNRKATNILRAAPAAWKLWVSQGDDVIERCRRRVARNRIVRVNEQYLDRLEDTQLLDRIVTFFHTNRYTFEGLASLVAQKILGINCIRGWVTKRSGDGGIDFVSRLDVGSDFSRSSMVILGQSKCTLPHRAVNSRDLARVVARLQRGWLGVYVTTGVFSESAQEELLTDKYPIVLINGKRLVREIRLIMNAENISLEDLLNRERKWYEEHLEPVDPVRIIDQTMFGTNLHYPTEYQGVV